MSKGTLKICLLKVDLASAKGISNDHTVVQLRIGMQKSVISGKGKSFESNLAALFSYECDQVLEIYISPYNSSNNLVVYGEVKLDPLINFPNIKHFVSVQTIYMQKAIVKNQPSGNIQLQIVHIHQLDSILEISLISASLYRNTEAIGKMDPYVEIILEGITKKTTVKNGAGQNPIWNETFPFALKNVLSRMVINVKDKDVTTSDLVGSTQLLLNQLEILRQSKEWIPKIVDIMFDGKVAGRLDIATRFTLSSDK